MAKLNKADLIKKLVEDYGYEAEDLKLLTNAKLQTMIKDEEEEALELESRTTRMSSKVSKIKDEDYIAVMSGEKGTFIHRSLQTGREWVFEDFGQVDKMPFRELLTLRNTSFAVFKGGYLVILDPVVQKEFGLTEIYNNILTPENVEDVFKKDIEELEKFIDSLPEAMKATLILIARDMVEAKTLDSSTKIEFLEKKFNFSFKDNAPLDDVV